MRSLEERRVERPPVALEAVAQRRERAVLVHPLAQVTKDLLAGFVAVERLQLGPLLRLGLANEGEHRSWEDRAIAVEIVVELRGEAPGVREGGVIDHVLHSLHVECPVTAVPEKLEVNINSLQLSESLSVADMQLPEGVVVQGALDRTVVWESGRDVAALAGKSIRLRFVLRDADLYSFRFAP